MGIYVSLKQPSQPYKNINHVNESSSDYSINMEMGNLNGMPNLPDKDFANRRWQSVLGKSSKNKSFNNGNVK